MDKLDDSYLQFVVSLLDDDGIDLPGKSEDADPDDFLPLQREFLINRDRAFSWDVCGEENLHPEIFINAALEKATKKQKVGAQKQTIKIEKPNPIDAVAIKSENLLSGSKRDCLGSIKEEILVPKVSDMLSMNMNVNMGMNMGLTMPTLNMGMGPMGMNGMNMNMGMNMTPMLPSYPFSVHSCSEVRIGAYTKEERLQVLERFRAKKQRRVWRKQIKYDCRKRLADTRPRVKGRFVSRKGFLGANLDCTDELDSDCSGALLDNDASESVDLMDPTDTDSP